MYLKLREDKLEQATLTSFRFADSDRFSDDKRKH